MHNCVPFLFVPITTFHDGLLDIKMTMFNRTIGLGVIGRNVNMADTVAGSKKIEGFNDRFAIVSNYFFKNTPMTENVFKNESAKGRSSFSTKHTKFGIGRK
jgi:hypothetical protein